MVLEVVLHESLDRVYRREHGHDPQDLLLRTLRNDELEQVVTDPGEDVLSGSEGVE
jgi:hypothetical protein